MTSSEALACLYVVRWAAYSRSPSVLSHQDREHEFKRLMAKKLQWAKDGRMPLPPDREEPDYCHVLRIAIGSVEDLDPSPQEAFLTVELAGHAIGFTGHRYLASYCRNPWPWWVSEAPNGQESVKAGCRELLFLLESELTRKPGLKAQ